jgi:hypothetical protein
MFLPVLLVRDFGAWAFVVFAIPNVIGAAAMGWVLREGKSEKLVAQHGRAIGAFSFITSTFQIFFALWMFESEPMPGAAWLMLTVAVVFLWLMKRDAIWPLYLAIAALVISVVNLTPTLDSRTWDVATYGSRFNRGLLPLAAVCVFGFGLCPYLDATFHRARQALPTGAARGAFSVGFGVFFLVMIIFTACYAGLFISGYGPGRGITTAYNLIAAHWTVQLALTAALHWQSRPMPWLRALATTAVALLAWIASRFIHDPTMHGGEAIYRLFMGFYGLAFPAYVWICMLPTWRSETQPSRRHWMVLAIAVLFAAPTFWLGFIDEKMMWLLPGVAIVLLARLFVPWRDTRLVAYN